MKKQQQKKTTKHPQTLPLPLKTADKGSWGTKKSWKIDSVL